MVLGISTVLGVIGVIAAFGLFYLAERVFHFDRAHAQTMMYLKLSVAGHLTIFLTRTRGPFWSIRPAKILWMAVLGTQAIATLFAVYGFLMTPLGWGWALFVWAYALAWFIVNDRVKLLAYWIFDRPNAKSNAKAIAVPITNEKTKPQPVARPNVKVESKPEPKAATNSDAETPPNPKSTGTSVPESRAESKLASNAKPTADLTSRIANRAYTLYEEGGRKDGAAVQNWEQAESEIRKDLANAGSAPKTKVESVPEGKVESKSEAKDAPQSANTGPQPETKAVPESAIKEEPKTEAKPKTAADVPPQLVTRVHELYEKLGREDVAAVEDWERAQNKEHATK
jgi:H+-transporting ATPase